MSEIMKKPKWLDESSTYGPHPNITYYTCQQILSKFYQSVGYGSLKANYIPEELKEKKWKPDKDKTYKCWWYCTNPADPGEDVLLYIEEVGISYQLSMVDEYKKIISVLSKLSLQQLKDVFEYIKNRYYV